jgi:hypothetical protein
MPSEATGLERKLQIRSIKAMEADAVVRKEYAKAVEKARRREAAERRQYDLPPPAFKALADPGGWGGATGKTEKATSSMSGARAYEAPPVDKTFNFIKPEKGNRTVPLVAPTPAQWTASSWCFGGVTPSDFGYYSSPAPLDSQPRPVKVSSLPGFFQTDYDAFNATAWSPQAIRQRDFAAERNRQAFAFKYNNMQPIENPAEKFQTTQSSINTNSLGRSYSHGAFKRPTKRDRREVIFFDKFYPEEVENL